MRVSALNKTALVTLILGLFACTNEKSGSYNAGGYSLEQLQHDFDQYVGLIRRDHPMTFTDPVALDRTIDSQRERLRNGMSEMEFYGVMAPVGAAVRCGHTRTYLSERGREYLDDNGQCLPLEIRLVDSGLYVYKDFTSDATIPRGSRVLSINGHESAAIVERMRASQYADGVNITYKDYMINRSFARLFALLFGGSERFELEIESPGGRTSRTVSAMTPNRADQVDEQRYGRETGCRRLCMTFSDDNRYAVLTIRDFGYYEDVDAFTKPVGDFFARLESSGVDALILDVRGNDGGEPHCSSFLSSHLIPEPVRYFAADTPVYRDLARPIPVPRHLFTGDLFVLTDGCCFSSTGHMLSILRCHDRGIFVGEETGGSSACNNASKEHSMKYTGLRLLLPHHTFASSARCLPYGRGIPPHIEVRPTIHDLIATRDVVLEKAVSLLAGEERGITTLKKPAHEIRRPQLGSEVLAETTLSSSPPR